MNISSENLARAKWRAREKRWDREAELHHNLQRDKAFIRRMRRNKIKNPKSSFERRMRQYKKGMLSKKELRAQPGYEAFAFQKWMR